MPIKLPSWLNQLNQNLLKQPKNPQNNDLDHLNTGSKDYSNLYILISYAILGVFLCLFIINIGVSLTLNTNKNQLNNIGTRLDDYSVLENNYVDIATNLNLYKSLKSSEFLLTPKIDILYSNIPPSVTLNKLEVTKETFELNLEGSNPLVFSRLITQYLRSDLIDYIILNAVDLNTGTQTYSVRIEGFYR